MLAIFYFICFICSFTYLHGMESSSSSSSEESEYISENEEATDEDFSKKKDFNKQWKRWETDLIQLIKSSSNRATFNKKFDTLSKKVPLEYRSGIVNATLSNNTEMLCYIVNRSKGLLSVEEKFEIMSRLIIEWDANPNHQTPSKQTIAHKIAKHSDWSGYHLLMRKLVQQYSLSLNKQDALGQTPLHILVIKSALAPYEKLLMVGEMLSLGADPNIQNQEGDTAAHIAAYYKEKFIYMRLAKVTDNTLVNKTGLTYEEIFKMSDRNINSSNNINIDTYPHSLVRYNGIYT